MKLKYFDLAQKLSVKSTHPKHQLGCVIVKKNEVIGLGFNKFKTHPKSKHPFQMIHAELDATLGINRTELEGADAYVYRETKDGNQAIAKPCPYCEAALREVGIKNVYYTTDYGFDGLKLKETR